MRFFAPKAWLGGAGLAIGLVGMALTWRWLVGIAVGLLTAAFVLRFAERNPRAP